MNIKELENALGISRNSVRLDFSKWWENHFVYANSYSFNVRVLSVYHEILEHEYSDSEYWTIGGNEIVVSLLAEFDDEDWDALKVDLPNWNVYQLRLFCGILCDDYDQGSIADTIITQRSYIYGYIITIVDMLSAIDLMINFGFLLEGGPKPQALLDKLNSLFRQIESTPLIIENYTQSNYIEHMKSILAEVNKIGNYNPTF